MGTLVNGIKEIFATNQSTATHLPVCASDGTPQGRISVGDLASVLGEKYIAISSNNDLNDCKKIGVAYVWSASAPTNSPSGIQYAVMYNFISSGNGVANYRIQICVGRGGYASYMRVCENGVYSNWKEFSTDMPTFYKDYANLSSLASAVCGLLTFSAPSSGDADDIRTTGCWGSYGLSNTPIEGGHLLVCIRGAGDYMLQIFVRVTSETSVFVRSGIDRPNYGWLAWKQVV